MPSHRGDLVALQAIAEPRSAAGAISRLQAVAGNAVVAHLLADRSVRPEAAQVWPTCGVRPIAVTNPNTRARQRRSAAVVPVPVQRGPGRQLDTARTMTWETEDESARRAKLVRRTKIVADAWGEVGPMPPRVKVDRVVELSTADGRHARLRIGLTIYLDPSDTLPQSPEEALARAGVAVRGHRELQASGGDLVPAVEFRWYEQTGRVSVDSVTATFPDYAAWLLTPDAQEAAILRHLDTLPRRRVEPETESPSERSTAEKVADTVTDMTPVMGNLKDAYRLLTGRDPDTGERLGWGARLLAGIFAIPGLGTAVKWIGKPFRWLMRTRPMRKALDVVGRRLSRYWKRLTGKRPRALPSAVPKLKPARGHEMLNESIEHLKKAGAGDRIDMFDDFAKQIEATTKGSWSATKSVLQDGTAVFVGSAGHTLVITKGGKVYKGLLQNPKHFSLGAGGIPVPNLAELKELM